MSAAEMIVRIFIALLAPPLGILGLPGIGCGTLLLMCLLTLFFWVPGVIVAILLIVKGYDKTNR